MNVRTWFQTIRAREATVMWGILTAGVAVDMVWLVLTMGSLPGPIAALFSLVSPICPYPLSALLYSAAAGALVLWTAARDKLWQRVISLVIGFFAWYWLELHFLFTTLDPGI